MALIRPKDVRGWIMVIPSPKEVRGSLVLPPVRSGFREERLGSVISHHLTTFVESIAMNVGGPCVEGSSPPLKRVGVGGVIVLGARENRVHGEGRQGIDAPRVENNRHMLVKSGRTV
jgi:hypothetical protein